MLARLGSFIVRRRGTTLLGVLLLTVAAAVFGGGVARNLIAGGFEPAGAESVNAEEVLEESFGQVQPNVVLVVTADDGDVDSNERGRRGWRSPSSSPASNTSISPCRIGRSGIHPRCVATAETTPSSWPTSKAPRRRRSNGPTSSVEAIERAGVGGSAATVRAGGLAVVNAEVTHTIEDDLLTAEMIAIPITLVLLVWVFGSIVAALLPLAVGIFSIITTFAILQLFAQFTDVSIFALNATTALGLGLAIDYSLFIVSRYREELAGGHPPGDAVVRTVRTAGRTILFSAVTVAIGLSAMLVFPIPFMRSFGYAGMGVAATAAFGAVVMLPAMLAALGHRVEKGRVFKRRPVVDGEGVWHRLAVFVMRRPLPIATAVIALLLLLGAPFLGIRLGTPDDRVLAPGADVRETHDILREDYAAGEAATIQVVVPDVGRLDVRARSPTTPPSCRRWTASPGSTPSPGRTSAEPRWRRPVRCRCASLTTSARGSPWCRQSSRSPPTAKRSSRTCATWMRRSGRCSSVGSPPPRWTPRASCTTVCRGRSGWLQSRRSSSCSCCSAACSCRSRRWSSTSSA